MGGSPWEGSEELWAAMAQAALNEGHAVTISVYRWSSLPPQLVNLQSQGARLLHHGRARMPRLDRMLGRVLQRPVRLPRPRGLDWASSFHALFDRHPDVICISQGDTYDALNHFDLVQMLYASAIPYIVVCQANSEGTIEGWRRDEAREFLGRASRVVFVSQHNLRATERQLAENLPNAQIVQNPVNLTDTRVAPWPEGETICIASVARLQVEHKGHDILFETLGTPPWRTRNWLLRCYGKGPDREYLEALARHYNIGERTEFCGFVQDVRSIWVKNHLLALASRREGSPLSLVEAMLCGRPSVVTDVGGNAEWVEDGHSGFVADAPTAASFGAALERAWQAVSKWQEMGMEAHARVWGKFDRAAGQTLLGVVLEDANRARPDRNKLRNIPL